MRTDWHKPNCQWTKMDSFCWLAEGEEERCRLIELTVCCWCEAFVLHSDRYEKLLSSISSYKHGHWMRKEERIKVVIHGRMILVFAMLKNSFERKTSHKQSQWKRKRERETHDERVWKEKKKEKYRLLKHFFFRIKTFFMSTPGKIYVVSELGLH